MNFLICVFCCLWLSCCGVVVSPDGAVVVNVGGNIKREFAGGVVMMDHEESLDDVVSVFRGFTLSGVVREVGEMVKVILDGVKN